jgi:hypothetical protein
MGRDLRVSLRIAMCVELKQGFVMGEGLSEVSVAYCSIPIIEASGFLETSVLIY